MDIYIYREIPSAPLNWSAAKSDSLPFFVLKASPLYLRNRLRITQIEMNSSACAPLFASHGATWLKLRFFSLFLGKRRPPDVVRLLFPILQSHDMEPASPPRDNKFTKKKWKGK
jgi:hypothetical protein